ncbi:hypothetical protein DPMN_004410 [Dreissena polymorpha]|uniref:Uncharacterized protein n=1 Tax=Dreissena polymorpha TaxID=45954 RepID=A0A9D4MQS0_DREPO|nr:hypothetical protein DPMN_004410 [Dreissena polymorpha]
MEFRVFPEVKSQLRGIRFASKQELTVAAKRIVSSFDADCFNTIRDIIMSHGTMTRYHHVSWHHDQISACLMAP